MEPETTSTAFADIGTRFERILADEEFWRHRDAELALEREEAERAKAAKAAAVKAARWEAVPEVYREEFDPKAAKYSRDVVAKAKFWTPDSGRGIGLMGGSGLGKTRLLVAVLRLHQQWSFLWLPASEFSRAVADEWSDDFRVAGEAEAKLRAAHRVKILLLDDVGDERATDASTAALKALVEHRTSRRLPILWTSNLTEEQIEARHGERGKAIVRRLAEFSWTP